MSEVLVNGKDDVQSFSYDTTKPETDGVPVRDAYLDEADKISNELITLTNIENGLVTNGINYKAVASLESLYPGILTTNMPVGGFTYDPSKQNLTYALEAISYKKILLIGTVIAAIVKAIIAWINRIRPNSAKLKEQSMALNESLKNYQRAENNRPTPKVESNPNEAFKLTGEGSQAEQVIARLEKEANFDEFFNVYKFLSNGSDVWGVESKNELLGKMAGDPGYLSRFRRDITLPPILPIVISSPGNSKIELSDYFKLIEEGLNHIRGRSEDIEALNVYISQSFHDQTVTLYRSKYTKLHEIINKVMSSQEPNELAATRNVLDAIANDWETSGSTSTVVKTFEYASNMAVSTAFDATTKNGEMLLKLCQDVARRMEQHQKTVEKHYSRAIENLTKGLADKDHIVKERSENQLERVYRPLAKVIEDEYRTVAAYIKIFGEIIAYSDATSRSMARVSRAAVLFTRDSVMVTSTFNILVSANNLSRSSFS